MTPRHLLVVSYYHPPFPTSGGNRWVAMARHLRAKGHRVSFVASDAFGALPDDTREGVTRTGDLKASAPLRRVLGRGELPEGGAGAVVEAPAPAVLTQVLVPDAEVVSWVPSALRAVRRRIAEGDVDVLVTTGPPDSAHLVGLGLGRRRIPWIADFRDGWTFEPLRDPFPTAAQRRLDHALERRVVRSADAVVGVTAPIAEDFRRRYGVRAAHVSNGYDAALDEQAAAERLPPLPDDRHLVVHTGGLSGPRGRDSGPLLRALASLEPEAAGRLALVQAGPTVPEEEVLLKPLRAAGLVLTLGVVGRPLAVALQRRADALLLITSDHVSQSTGKLYEYLAARRPIIALAKDNEAARIVEETGAGVTIAPGDEAAIAAALRRVALEPSPGPVRAEGIDRYIYPGPADAMEAVVEDAIHLHSRRT